MKKKHSKKPRTKGDKAILIISIAVVALLAGCYFLIPSFHDGVNNAFVVLTSGDQDRIQEWVKQFKAWGPVIIILSMVAQMFALLIPNLILFMIAIVCYGPVWGSLICITGVFLSSSIGYFIGRKLGPRAIDRFVSENIQEKIKVFVERYGVKTIFIARFSSFSSDGISFVAGILEMNYRKYILSTLAGIVPLVTILSLYGMNGNMELAFIWIAAVSLTGLGLYIFLDRKKRRSIYTSRAIQVKPRMRHA